MKIGDLARQSGLSAHTLRYYERIGLLSYTHRDASHHRDYDPSILTWIDLLKRLRASGMPIRTMLNYADLREQGPSTMAQRRALLETHRDTVRAHVAEMTACLDVLDGKITGYSEAESRMKDYGSDLPTRRRKPAGSR